MKIVIAFLVVCALLLPVGFSFSSIQEYIEGTADTFMGAIETVKGMFGNDKFNLESPSLHDVGGVTLKNGATGEMENVKDYVDWRLKRDIQILNEDRFVVKHVSNILYDVYIRPPGSMYKYRYTAMRLTISYHQLGNNSVEEADCLWIGVYPFNNATTEEYPMQTWNPIGTDKLSTNLYCYTSDNSLTAVFDGSDILNKGRNKFIVKYPKSISSIKQTFTDFWQEWTGG